MPRNLRRRRRREQEFAYESESEISENEMEENFLRELNADEKAEILEEADERFSKGGRFWNISYALAISGVATASLLGFVAGGVAFANMAAVTLAGASVFAVMGYSQSKEDKKNRMEFIAQRGHEAREEGDGRDAVFQGLNAQVQQVQQQVQQVQQQLQQLQAAPNAVVNLNAQNNGREEGSAVLAPVNKDFLKNR